MATTASAAAVIAPATALGAVSLTVRDLDRARSFYTDTIGLEPREQDDGTVAMYAGSTPLVRLHGDSSAPALDRGRTGLFHLAILVPDRRRAG